MWTIFVRYLIWYLCFMAKNMLGYTWYDTCPIFFFTVNLNFSTVQYFNDWFLLIHLLSHPFCTFPSWPLTIFCLNNLTGGPFSLPIICSVPGSSWPSRDEIFLSNAASSSPMLSSPPPHRVLYLQGWHPLCCCLNSFEVIFHLTHRSLGVPEKFLMAESKIPNVADRTRSPLEGSMG